MLAGWVPLKLFFAHTDAKGFTITPPQSKLEGARNYDLSISVTIRFEQTPEYSEKDMIKAARGFFNGNRKGELLEFGIATELRGRPSMKAFYFGPDIAEKTEQGAAVNR